MNGNLVVLVLVLLVFTGSMSALVETSDSSEAADDLGSQVFLISYRTSSGLHLSLHEKSVSAYQNCDLYLYGNGSATVTVDGVSEIYSLSGLKLIHYDFETGSSHTIETSGACGSYSFSFKVSKSISIKDLDAEDLENYVTISESSLNMEKVKAALFAFLSSVIGFYIAYKFLRKRAAEGMINV